MREDFTVFVVDDDVDVAAALSRLIRLAGFNVETFVSAEDFLEKHREEVPGCAILDVIMNDGNGLDVHRQLLERNGERPVIFISGSSDLPTGVAAMKAGAIDFLTKPLDAEKLFHALEKAVEQDSEARRRSAETASIKARLASLTRRERAILDHVIEGKLNKEVALALGLAEKTVKFHRGQMLKKMGVRNAASLVRLMDRLDGLTQA
jgi:FixJ family two-component response regulator